MIKAVHTRLLRKLFASKSFYLFLLVLLALAARVVLQFRSGSQGLANHEIVLAIYYRIINDKMLQYLIIPFCLLLAGPISSLFDSYKVLLRYRSARQWWREKMWGMGYVVLICTLMLNLVTLGAVMASGHSGDINPQFAGFILLGMALQIAGLLILGALCHLISLISSHHYTGFLVTFLLIYLIDTIRYIFRLELVTLPEYMSLMFGSQAGKAALAPDCAVVVWLLMIFIVLYLLGASLAQLKDFYWRA